MAEITLQPNTNVGSASSHDGSAVVLDALLASNCRLSFPKLPDVQFWLLGVELPTITVNEVKQVTRYVDPNQIGEKLNFIPFTVTFTVDKYMKNWSSIFNWMKAMTVQGSAVDHADNPVLIVNNSEVIKFVGSWPTALGGIHYTVTDPEAMYVTATLTLNYDYIDYIGQFANSDSTYHKPT